MKGLMRELAIASWFTGGILLGTIEIVKLPANPTYSVVLQLLPLAFLVGGISVIFCEYQMLGKRTGHFSRRMRLLMNFGWIAVFGVNAGLASLNNMATDIFHGQLPYYFQGVNLGEKIIALAGIFVLGTTSILVIRFHVKTSAVTAIQQATDFWERPLTNIGFIALLLGIVMGLAQYWTTIVFSGFFLLLTGIMLYPVGRLTEKGIIISDDEADGKS